MSVTKIDGKTKDGKQAYRVSVSRVINGKRVQKEKTVYGKAEALSVEASLGGEIYSAMTFGDFLEEYLSFQKGEVRTSTYVTMEKQLRHYVEPYFSSRAKMSSISPSDVLKWKTTLNSTSLSTITKNSAYKRLRALFNYAVEMEVIPKSPVRVKGFSKTDFEDEELHYYTYEQFAVYISYIRARAEKLDTITAWGAYVFFSLAFYTGARKGEINALRWTDIEGDTIRIRRSVDQKNHVEGATKNRSSVRDIKLPQRMVEVLNEQKQKQKALPQFTEGWTVCGGPRYLSDTTIENINIEAANATGLPHIRIHDFRHSHASLLANAGINIQEVARRLGHTDVRTTWQIYSHLYPAEEDRAVKMLDSLEK